MWPHRWLNCGTPPLAEDMKVCYEVANKSSGVTLAVRTGQDGEDGLVWSQNKMRLARHQRQRQRQVSLADLEAIKLSKDTRLTRVPVP